MDLTGPDYWGNKRLELRCLLSHRWHKAFFIAYDLRKKYPEMLLPEIPLWSDVFLRSESAGIEVLDEITGILGKLLVLSGEKNDNFRVKKKSA